MVFPLEKRVGVAHLFMMPRTGHLHDGADLWTPKMTKVIAAVSGTVILLERTYEGKPWYALWLAGDDGRGYYYSHLNNDSPGTDNGTGGRRYAFAPGLATGARVQQGQFVAYSGDSGNAEQSSPHMHFEVHETTEISSPAIDPFDSLYRAPLANGAPAPGWALTTLAHYEQTDARLTKTGTWKTIATSGVSGGSYAYADSRAAALVWFVGTSLDWIATTGPMQGVALVSVDGAASASVDLYGPDTLRKQKVWSTGILPQGTHTVTITWTGKRSSPGGGTRVNVDALDVKGRLIEAPRLIALQQSAWTLKYEGTWTVARTTQASGGSYRVTASQGTAFTGQFTGLYAALIGKTGPAYGIAEVSVDGAAPEQVDFYSSSALYQQKVWNSGLLPYGTHIITLKWTGLKNPAASGTAVTIDALQLIGALNPIGRPPAFGPEAMSVIP